MNAVITIVLVAAIIFITVDGVIKVRATLRKANRPVSDRRINRMHVIDPGLELIDGDAE